MKDRYRLFRRERGIFYARDSVTMHKKSLRTSDPAQARHLIAAMNQTAQSPQLNRALAKTYASAVSPELMTRTWQDVIQAYVDKSADTSRSRVERAFRSAPFAPLRPMRVNETDAVEFLKILSHKVAGNSTNHYLRRLQNYALGMSWLFHPVIPEAAWPKITKKRTVAITAEEHAKILASEKNPEHRLYYSLLWETGGSQRDIAELTRDRINLEENTLCFHRAKLRGRQQESGEVYGLSKLAIGPRIQAILDQCPKRGRLFPTLAKLGSNHRTTEFMRRCRVAGVKNRQLKSYRYAWAQRARAAGMPEREAMNHLGHKSRAIHAAYAADAHSVTLPLEHYETIKGQKVIQFSNEQNKGHAPHSAALTGHIGS